MIYRYTYMNMQDNTELYKVIISEFFKGLPTQENGHDCGVFTVMV